MVTSKANLIKIYFSFFKHYGPNFPGAQMGVDGPQTHNQGAQGTYLDTRENFASHSWYFFGNYLLLLGSYLLFMFKIHFNNFSF